MEKSKYVRKHYFINPRFQTRFLLSFVIPIVVIIFFIGIIMFISSRSIINATLLLTGDEIHNIIQSKQMLITDENKMNGEIVEQIKKYEQNCRAGGTSEFFKNLLLSTSKILVLGLFVVVIEMAILTIFVSHKIAGPIYRFEKFAQSVQEGDLSARIHLRKGDEMIETAEKFNEMMDELVKPIQKAKNLLQEYKKENAGKSDKLCEVCDLMDKFKTS